ncbi:MAG: HAD-IA family hydrolase [Paracoccaceae bacterium]
MEGSIMQGGVVARIAFDLDGTLIDSVADIHAAVTDVLQGNGIEPLDLTTILSFVGNGLPHLMYLVVERLGLDMDRHAALSQSVLDRYNQHATSHTRLYPGVRGALEKLASAGHSLGVCTNKPEEPARSVVQHLDLGPFECIVGGDTFPERKPQPGPLKATFAALKGGPMLFVGDSEVDAETAQRAQVPFLLYTEGYRKTAVSEIPHHAAFSHFDQLPSCVLDCLSPRQ